MKSSIWFAGASVVTMVAVWAGCSSNGGGTVTGTTTGTHTTTGTEATTGAGASTTSGTGTHTTTGTSSGTTTGTGGAGAGGSGAGGDPFECTVPSPSPSNGTCVTVVPMNDAGTGIECNPVTNAGCATGYACDIGTDNAGNDAFQCFGPPNDAKVCATCDSQNGPFCVGGLTCYLGGNCAKYCCTDADCGSGKCTTMDSNGPLFDIANNLGVCTNM